MSGLVELVVRRNQLWVTSYAQTVDGFWVAGDVTGPLAVDLADDELGEAVLDACQRSRQGVPTPTVEELSRPSIVVTATGARSFSDYVRGVRSVNAEFDGDTVTITPTDNRGARGGLVPLVDLALRVTQSDAARLGAAIRAQLDLAT